MSQDRIKQLRKLVKQCGTWCIARKLCKEGVPVEIAVQILATRARCAA